MKQLATFILAFMAISYQAIAQEEQSENLLDGTLVEYYYQNESGVSAEFIDGKFNYKWIAGPNKGVEGSEKYLSRKIGDKLYMISFMVVARKSYVTIIFNFNQNIFSTSALLSPGTDKEMILFEEGTIEQLTLKEK